MPSHSSQNQYPEDEGFFGRLATRLKNAMPSSGRSGRSHVRDSSEPDLSRASYERGWSDPYERRKSKTPGRARALVVVLALLVAVVCVAGIRIGMLKGNVDNALDQVDAVSDALQAGDSDGIREASGELQKSVTAVDRQIHSLPWNLMIHLPVVGRDVKGVQDITAAVGDFCDSALPTLDSVADEISVNDLFVNGAVNTAELVSIQGFLREIAPELRIAADEISAVPTARINRLDSLESKAKSTLMQVADIVDTVAEVDLPAIFGANEEKRTYLVIAQTNAELRATGGFPGAWVPVTVQDGKIELGTTVACQHHETDFDWTEEEREVFYITGERDTSGLNFSPNFPVVAPRLAHAYEDFINTYNEEHTDEEQEKAYDNYILGLSDDLEIIDHEEMNVAGVIAIDPVFLQRLLSLTKGVKVYKQKVDGTNAAEMLMHTAYVKFSPRHQDLFFSRVASKGFKKIMSGLDKINKGKLLKILTKSAKDYRLQVWMKNEQEERLVDAMGMAGSISDDETRPELGVYVNDNTWAKIDWYLDMRTEIGRKHYNSDGTTTYPVTTTFTNTGTYDELMSINRYVAGYNRTKTRRDDMILYPLLMAPAGGTISNVEVSKGNDFMEFSLYGRDVWEGFINVHAEQTVTVTYDVTVSANAQTDMTLRTTALAQQFD